MFQYLFLLLLIGQARQEHFALPPHEIQEESLRWEIRQQEFHREFQVFLHDIPS